MHHLLNELDGSESRAADDEQNHRTLFCMLLLNLGPLRTNWKERGKRGIRACSRINSRWEGLVHKNTHPASGTRRGCASSHYWTGSRSLDDEGGQTVMLVNQMSR